MGDDLVGTETSNGADDGFDCGVGECLVQLVASLRNGRGKVIRELGVEDGIDFVA
jgi:hypothetical protein